MKISESLSAKLANMSFVCMLLVVGNHIRYGYVSSSLYGMWERLIPTGICTIAVPSFFVMSGFLLAGHMNESGWVLRELRKRVKTLLLPAICWMVIYAIYSILLVMLSNGTHHRPLFFTYSLAPIDWMRRLGLSIWSQPAPGQLWYIRALLLFVLCGALFKWLNSLLGLVFMFLLYVFICPFQETGWRYPFRFFWSLEGSFYFLVGIYLRTHDLSKLAPSNLRRIAVAFLLGFFLLGARVMMDSNERQLASWFAFGAIPSLIYGLWGMLPANRWPSAMGSLSFPIFILHILALRALSYAANFCGLFHKAGVLNWMGKFSFAVLCSATVTFILRRFLPRSANLLFGGR